MHCLIDLRLITGIHSSALLIYFRAQEESLSLPPLLCSSQPRE
ncbi:unnamed protein product, partial [Musa hybrid cultivar]